MLSGQASHWWHIVQGVMAKAKMTFTDTAQCASEGPRHRQTLRQGYALCLSRWYRLRLPQTNKHEVVHGVVSLDVV